MLQAASTAAAPLISATGTRASAQLLPRKIGFALCGLGSLSEQQIAPAFAKTAHCRLTGVITRTPEKARGWQARYGIPERSVYTYDTMERMAENPDIDVVYIVTPNAEHPEQTARAARAGKHVFCEKPMAVSVGGMYPHRPRRRVRCHPHDRRRLRVFVGRPDQWRLKHALSGGGALVDVGIYALQATRYLTGEDPIEVSAFESKTDAVKFAQVDEQMSWLARFPGGAVANCAASYNMSGLNSFRVHAEHGWFGLDPAFGYAGNRGERSDGKATALPERDLFAAELDDFARCILEGRPSKVSGEEGLKDARIMRAIYESARTGRAVRLS